MGRFCELVHLLGWRLLESFWTGLLVRTKPEDFVFLGRPAQGALAPHSQLSLSPFPCFLPHAGCLSLLPLDLPEEWTPSFSIPVLYTFAHTLWAP